LWRSLLLLLLNACEYKWDLPLLTPAAKATDSSPLASTPLPTQDYLSGYWPAARAGFDALLVRPGPDGVPREDAPARVLLGFMGSHGFAAPPGWAGYRELTEK
jgi:hypothetical protein